MKTRILIVEDQFVEANAVKIALEKAGYEVCGMAMSYEQALPYIRMARPDIVLLDIFLKGDLTGVDLARVLSKEGIPFVYLSANSNQSTLDEAIATRPYGFLVKPFREKDLRIALEIAGFRHQYIGNLAGKQEKLIRQLLNNVTNEKLDPVQRRILLAKAFKQFIPFEYIVVDTDLSDEDPNAVFCCQRVGYDDYVLIAGGEYLQKSGLQNGPYYQWRKEQANLPKPLIEDGVEFARACNKDHVLKVIAESCRVRSRMVIPVLVDGKPRMHVSFFAKQDYVFQTDHLDIFEPLGSNLSVVLHQAKRVPFTEEAQDNHLPVHISTVEKAFEHIVGKSSKLLQALDQVVHVADYDTSVLILGETGVGKEGLVTALHQLSGRRKQPLVKINCAAIPSSLIESVLFGHERGAFTGATERRIGKFEQAQGGTIFLDEIGEIPLEIQAKLLRVLQEKEIERVGGRATIKINVRVVAATNHNLYKDVAAGKFRMDLYYRINVFPISLPPLRERKEDISLLASHFLNRHAVKNRNALKSLSEKSLTKLISYNWPGNIRELEHFIERHVVLNAAELIEDFDLPEETFLDLQQQGADHLIAASGENNEKSMIEAALKSSNGKVSGKDGAAELLGMSSSVLYSKIKKLQIAWNYVY